MWSLRLQSPDCLVYQPAEHFPGIEALGSRGMTLVIRLNFAQRLCGLLEAVKW
jgi:hypothetical protein